jgi:putative transposase
MASPAEISAARSVIVDHILNSGCQSIAYAVKLFNWQHRTGQLQANLETAHSQAWQKSRAGILSVSTLDKWRANLKKRGHFEPLVRQKDYTVKPWHELAYHIKRRNPKAKQTYIHKRLLKKYPEISIFQLRRFFSFIEKEGDSGQ